MAFHWGDTTFVVGASGVVAGLMGAAARFVFSPSGRISRQFAHLNRRLTVGEALSNRSVVVFAGIWFLTNFLIGLGVFAFGGAEALPGKRILAVSCSASCCLAFSIPADLTFERSAISPRALDFREAVAHHSYPKAAITTRSRVGCSMGKKRDRNDICLADWSPPERREMRFFGSPISRSDEVAETGGRECLSTAILNEKGRQVVTVDPHRWCAQAVRLLHENRIGAIVVVKPGDRIAGILTERDVVAAMDKFGAECLDKPVSAVMWSKVHSCTEEMSITTSWKS